MKPYRATAARIIHAAPEKVYAILADYRNGHPNILPKAHFSLIEVEKGGVGAGTIIRFQMKVLGKIQNYRASITEPVPGHRLDEIYSEPEGIVTRFVVQPFANDQQSKVTIITEGPTTRIGVAGWLERVVAGHYLRRIFKQELNLLAELAEGQVSQSQPACKDAG